MVDFVQVRDECAVPLVESGIYHTDAFDSIAKYNFTKTTLVLTAIETSQPLPAGVPFSFAFRLFNPKRGQDAPALQVRMDNLLIGGGPEHGGYGPAGGGMALGLAWRTLQGCRSPPERYPLRVDAPFFSRKALRQSSPFPGDTNVLTLTLATNVGLPVKCRPVITLSGLRGATPSLPRPALPGTRAGEWRGDMCPSTDRGVVALLPVNGSGVDTLFSSMPLGDAAWHATDGTFVPAAAECGGRAALRDCRGATVCVSDSVASEAGRAPWQLVEAELTRARGQRPVPPSYPRAGALARLGDGACDAQWDCAAFAWDDGDCAPAGLEPTPNLTYGTARWSDDLDGALIMHLTRGNIGGEEYVLQVQVTNPAVPQNSVAVSIESNGIEIARVAVDRAFEGARCDSGKVQPDEDRNPLNVYAPHLLVADIGHNTTVPGALNILSVTLATNVHLSPRMLTTLTVSGLEGASARDGLMALASPLGDDAHLSFTVPPTPLSSHPCLLPLPLSVSAHPSAFATAGAASRDGACGLEHAARVRLVEQHRQDAFIRCARRHSSQQPPRLFLQGVPAPPFLPASGTGPHLAPASRAPAPELLLPRA